MAHSTVVTMEVVFDHIIKGRELTEVIKEGLKHLLYIRRQLPLPLQMLQYQSSAVGHRNQGGPDKHLGRVARVHANKREAAISAVEETLDAIDYFMIDRKIHSMAILFGCTVVRPKEVFLLRPEFGTLVMEEDEDYESHSEEEIASLTKRMDRARRSFVESLVINKDLSSLGDIRPTSVFIFALAARDSQCSTSEKFLPKQTYRLPDKGKYYDIVLTDKGTTWNWNFQSNNRHPVDKLRDIQRQSDLVWYQANISLKGYREARTSMF